MVQILHSLNPRSQNRRANAEFRKRGSKNKFRRLLSTIKSHPVATVIGARLVTKLIDKPFQEGADNIYNGGKNAIRKGFIGIKNKVLGTKPPVPEVAPPPVPRPILRSKQKK